MQCRVKGKGNDIVCNFFFFFTILIHLLELMRLTCATLKSVAKRQYFHFNVFSFTLFYFLRVFIPFALSFPFLPRGEEAFRSNLICFHYTHLNVRFFTFALFARRSGAEIERRRKETQGAGVEMPKM